MADEGRSRGTFPAPGPPVDRGHNRAVTAFAHGPHCPDCAGDPEPSDVANAVVAYGALAAADLPAWRPPDAARAAAWPRPRRWRWAAAAMVAVALGAAAGLARRSSPSPAVTTVARSDGRPSLPAAAAATAVTRRPTAVQRRATAAAVARAPGALATDSDSRPPVAVPPHGAVPAAVDPAAAPPPAPVAADVTAVVRGAAPPDDGRATVAPPAVAPTAPPGREPAPTTAEPTRAAPPPTTAPTHPADPALAIVAGHVTGPDGFPRAEVRVVARPAADGIGDVVATTGVDGAYALTMPPGLWSIAAEGAAYLTAWNGQAASPLDAPSVRVTAGEPTALDIRLTAAPPGRISGRVVDDDGAPAPGALVVAAAPDEGRGGYRAFVAATLADSEGRYRLPVAEGAWLVAAAADWRAPVLSWWGGDGDLISVDHVPVALLRPADGIDVRLRPAANR